MSFLSQFYPNILNINIAENQKRHINNYLYIHISQQKQFMKESRITKFIKNLKNINNYAISL